MEKKFLPKKIYKKELQEKKNKNSLVRKSNQEKKL